MLKLFKKYKPAVFIVGFGIAGIILLVITHAATPTASVEAENGTPSAQAQSITDASASGGRAVKFGSATSASWWQPGTAPLPWQWEIDHEIVTTNAGDMGSNGTLYSGGAAPAPVVIDIDGFDSTAADVSALHALNKKVICYIEVGAAENYRPDYSQFPAATLGSGMPGYPTEKYLNINNATVVSVIEARISMCHQKGFDAIEPDIDDSYTDSTGFSISEAQNVQYLTTLSNFAHSLGMAWGLKNGGDGGTPSTFIPDMIPHIDFALVEEPYALGTINYFYPAVYNAGKALFVAENTSDTTAAKFSTYCPTALTQHTNTVLLNINYNGTTHISCN